MIVCNRIILGSVGLTANRPELVIIIKNISGEQDKNNVKISVYRDMKIFEFTELKNRFEIRPPRWKARHYIWELTSFLLMAGAGVWLFFCWDSISEEVAVHFDIQGQIDRKDSKEHLLIVWGMLDLGKAVVAAKDDEIKKATKSLAFRAVAGILIFFIPTLVSVIIGMVSNFASSGAMADYNVCRACISSPYGDECAPLAEDAWNGEV